VAYGPLTSAVTRHHQLSVSIYVVFHVCIVSIMNAATVFRHGIHTELHAALEHRAQSKCSTTTHYMPVFTSILQYGDIQTIRVTA
jgi:hypothetical protein